MHRDALWRRDAHPHLVSFDAENCDGHVFADLQGFADASGENEHGTALEFLLLRGDFSQVYPGKPIGIAWRTLAEWRKNAAGTRDSAERMRQISNLLTHRTILSPPLPWNIQIWH
jgi:hypothetical protein